MTGIGASRARAASAEIQNWGVATLSARLCEPRSLDDVVRSTLLAEDFKLLVKRGAPTSKLISKLRDQAQFESVWAEIRCAAALATALDPKCSVELDRPNPDGTNTDVKLSFESDLQSKSVEIKSVGMSDVEVDFCRGMVRHLEPLVPPHGFMTIHAPLDAREVRLSRAELADGRAEAARNAAIVPRFPEGLSGAVIVAHGAEENYLRRVGARIVQALRQLPDDDECWVAIYWTNGEASGAIADVIDWTKIPEHVAGIYLVGSVLAFPHQNIDVFVSGIPRGYRSTDRREVRSDLEDEFAKTVLERMEASSGVRATVLYGRIRGKRRQILLRDGSERIPPFFLLVDRDPTGLEIHGVDRGSRASGARRG